MGHDTPYVPERFQHKITIVKDNASFHGFKTEKEKKTEEFLLSLNNF